MKVVLKKKVPLYIPKRSTTMMRSLIFLLHACVFFSKHSTDADSHIHAYTHTYSYEYTHATLPLEPTYH